MPQPNRSWATLALVLRPWFPRPVSSACADSSCDVQFDQRQRTLWTHSTAALVASVPTRSLTATPRVSFPRLISCPRFSPIFPPLLTSHAVVQMLQDICCSPSVRLPSSCDFGVLCSRGMRYPGPKPTIGRNPFLPFFLHDVVLPTGNASPLYKALPSINP